MTLSSGFLREARRWIALNTVTTRSNGALIARAQWLLRALGFTVHPQKVVEGGIPFFNLLARRGPAGQPLLLNTHTDTVPSGPVDRWTMTGGDPFRLTRRGGFLHGLGVADVKLNLLCQIEALKRLGPIRFRKAVAIAATYGEERGLSGARALIKKWRGPRPALALAGEPTEMALIHRHRGYLVFEWSLPRGPRWRGRFRHRELLVRGKSVHSSTPHLGINALEKALDTLCILEKRGLAPRVAIAEGGTAHNQVPAEARLSLLAEEGRVPEGKGRLLPWKDLLRLRGIARRLPRSHSFNWAILRPEGDRWIVRFDLRFPPRDRPARLIRLVQEALRGAGRVRVSLNDPPLDAPRGGPSVRFLTKVLRGAGIPVRLKEKLTCTEAGLYDDWGAPAVVIGPGRSIGNIHRPNERIAIAQLEVAVRFYEELLRAWTTS